MGPDYQVYREKMKEGGEREGEGGGERERERGREGERKYVYQSIKGSY